jgi:uncharacterized protein YerC
MLVGKLARATFPRDVEEILSSVLSVHERGDIASRAAATELLRQGKSYRTIGDMLWLSPAVISALRKSMQSGDGYLPRHARWRIYGRKKKKYATLRAESRTIVVPPHGKRAFPRRVHS